MTAVVVAVVAVCAGARSARACVSCSCGSTAALPPGAEVPFAGRLRTGLTVQTSSTTTTDALGAAEVRAGAALLSLTAVAAPGLVLDAALPIAGRVRKHDSFDGVGVGLGDASFGARLVWADRGFAPRLLGSVRVGAAVPTTTIVRDALQRPLSPELQPGPKDVAVDVQLTLVWLPTSSWSVIAAAGGTAPLFSLDDTADGAGAEARVLGLWRFDPRASLRVGTELRAFGPSRDSGDALDPARLVAAPEVGVVVDVNEDVIVAAVVAVPVWGSHAQVRDGAVGQIAVFVDW